MLRQVGSLERGSEHPLAEAIVALGEAAREDQVLETTAQTIGKSTDDMEAQDLSWSVGTPLQEAWLAERAEARGS